MRSELLDGLDAGGRNPSRSVRRAALSLVLLGACLAGAASAQTITEFPVPTANSQPGGITTGPDGNIWFTEFGASKIGRITPAGTITEFPIAASSNPEMIALGSDGNLWFPEVTANKIGRITPAGAFVDFPILTPAASVIGIAAGSDGNLWFVLAQASKIGRITPAGVVTEFPVLSAGILLLIAAGPDGNLWFTNFTGGKIGRITTAGVVTEFPTNIPGSQPQGITAGPDGNVWFTDTGTNQIGRITPTGAITEFPIPSADANLLGITTGPDGNLWFAEDDTNKIGRITPAGVVTEFPIPTANCAPSALTAGPDGNLWFTEIFGNKIGRVNLSSVEPEPASVDAHAVAGTSSNVNGVLEPGETVEVSPAWKNTLVGSQSFSGTAASLTGPPGPTYGIPDATADYGTVAGGATANCHDATGNCYQVTVSGARPVTHWDAVLTEDLNVASTRWARLIHIGDSFADVPTTHPFYAFIENLFHSGATGGCGGGNYCPSGTVTRAQMAVFLLKGKFGNSHVPPPETGLVFADVHVGDFAAAWIEELAGLGITGGCGGGNYCPNNPVTRAQMAVFLLKAEHGSGYVPPACTPPGVFLDVPCPGAFTDWVEQLAAEGITAGCGGGNYCPDDPNIRGQMAVFLVKVYGMELYGP
jgi:streptogramin lyase